MKFIYTIFLTLLTSISFAQQDVPSEYWIEDSNFEEKINEHHSFGDDDKLPIVVEFWASFNAANCFADWDKICLLYTSPSPRDVEESRMPSSA